MLRFFYDQKRRTAEGGFTLIELVVVLAILGILLALAVPRYLGARKRAYKAEIDNILQEAKTLSWAYYQEHNVFPTAITDIALVMPGGAAWAIPALAAGGSTDTFIQWEATGNATGPILAADSCWITLSNDGNSDQSCTF